MTRLEKKLDEFMRSQHAFREDIVQRLTRIETNQTNTADHGPRIASLERSRARLKGATAILAGLWVVVSAAVIALIKKVIGS